MLWLSPEIELQAVTVSDGDCYVTQAFESILKMATFLDLEGAEVGYSEDPIKNAFPENWRRESFIINELPIFSDNTLKKTYQGGRARKSQALITDCLSNSKRPVTIVTTGPLTNVTPVFDNRADLKEKVEEVIVMGGALNVPGNVEQPEHDGSAEWNLYADPAAAKAFFDLGLPVRLIPLDVTNQVPITKDFLERLEKQADKYKASQLASKIYSLVKGFNYYFWDTLTAAAAIKPSLFTYKDVRIEVSNNGKSAGKTSPVFFGGKKIKAATAVDKEGFIDLMLECLRAK